MPTLRQLIYGDDHNPYAGFDPKALQLDLQGWGSDNPIFASLIANTKPAKIIEVGSWKGASAIHMANLQKKYGIVGEIVCVDTWLGTAQTWLERKDANYTALQFGRPMVYYQFIANVIHTGHTGTITPFPTDSLTGAAVLAARKVSADAIYIDAGHDFDHVSADLQAWWPLLRAGGIFFGDDYHPMWQGVIDAVQGFAKKNGLQVFTDPFPDKWHIVKPST